MEKSHPSSDNAREGTYKNIPTSWCTNAIMARALKRGHFYRTTLPHYRFRNIKRNCWLLQEAGMLEKVGKKDNAVILKPTELAYQWAEEARLFNNKALRQQIKELRRQRENSA